MTNRVMIIGEDDKVEVIKQFIKEKRLNLKVVDVWDYTPRDNNDKDKRGELFYVLPSELKRLKINVVIFGTDTPVIGIFQDIIPKTIEQYEFANLEHLNIFYSKKKNVMLFGSKEKFEFIEKLINDNPKLNMQVVDKWEYNPEDKSPYTINEISYELPNELNYMKIDIVIFTSDKENYNNLGDDIIHLLIKRYGIDEFLRKFKIKRKKLTHVSRFAYPDVGGIESVINQINDSLTIEEFEKEIFCCSKTEKSSIENGVKYNRCNYLFDFAANSISPQLFFKMMFLKTDIIHFHMPVIQNVVIWFILYHLGLLKYKKMIITYHGAIIGYDKYMKPFEGLYKYFYKKADKIHVLSPTIIDSDEILYSNRDKCTIIPYGIDTNINNIQDSKVLINGFDIEKFANGRKKLLCMGRLVKLKGYQLAIEAMKNIDNAVLLIAGEGTEYNNYVDYITQNNLTNRILLLGNVTNKLEKEFLFKASDIFLMPSLRTESFGIVQLEAMKHNAPVINTNLKTGMNYVSVDELTGLTIEPNSVTQLQNAICNLLNNNELCLQYGANARKRVEELFDITKIRKKYVEIYE